MVWIILIDGVVKGPAYSSWELANDRAIDLAKRFNIYPSAITIQGITVIGKPVYPIPFDERAS